jgi:hypothetical protein
MNAAVWFGAAVFFTFGMGPAAFSPEMKELLGAKNAPFFTGAIAQILVARYFHLQLACGTVALLHLVGEWVYLGRTPRGAPLGLLIGLVAIGLLGGHVLQPKLRTLHSVMYATNASPSTRDSAKRSFHIWHGVSQAINLLLLTGLAIYVWKIGNPSDSTRFVSTSKFRG